MMSPPQLGLVTLVSLLLSVPWAKAVSSNQKQPNVVFILTDDQDYEMHSLDYMPLLQRHVVAEGASFDRHYCTVAICCPSRVNLWTGRAAHNTNVTDLAPPYGGYPKFVAEGLNSAWLPVWLQELGYNTYYTGKLFNAHNIQNYNNPYVQGFNGSDFLLDPYTYEYFNSQMTRNGQPPVSYAGQYSVDVVIEKGLSFLDEAMAAKQQTDRPFFVAVAPIAPHVNMRITKGSFGHDMPFYAERHKHLFKDYTIPRTPNYNVRSGVGWVRELPELNETVLQYHDEFVRSRLRSLQAVDELVASVVASLERTGELDNTFIFYTSDNGYHVGQHRLSPGKECSFEEDIHVPLVVRGPGVPKGIVAGVVSSHTDLAPTILKLAGSERKDLDGLPIPLTLTDIEHPQSGEHVNVEFWGAALSEGKYRDRKGSPESGYGAEARNNTYKALRLRSTDEYNILYVVWCTGDKEFYDLKRDPHQIHNLLNEDGAHFVEDYRIAGRSFEHVLDRVDSLLMVTKSCKSETCRRPWSALHPDGNVDSLRDALRQIYDAFYREQLKVSFSSCQMGYIKGEEGPQQVNMWNDYSRRLPAGQQVLQLPGHWSWWT